ncbi:TonB-dependent siderophore receptor [Pararobbsia silviterrae]|uniref:TonB-dependent siderophore receptor n=1 Tax=Pararobbsia silviterrae TaxID=1792498 RepID=A0A494Y5M1_9BURK|nr:TonB-dependent siderophore receptor [Pararobbsia silviterrae]RKP57573.1 TonB-dependent siderophore receptor [Pararobbsia silviterrae]
MKRGRIQGAPRAHRPAAGRTAGLRRRAVPLAIALLLTDAAWAQSAVSVPGAAASGAAASSATAPAAASDATATDQPLPAVVVTGQRAADGATTGYVAQTSTTATKTSTPLIRTPQSVSVVTRDQMDIQDPQSVAQALRYTSGINPEQRGTNTDSLEYLYARGFLVDEFWNGLRTPGPSGGFGFNVTSFDPYMFESIDYVHGPASVLYGQSSPGGIVNLVSKMPTSDPYHEIGFQTGSYGRVQGFFDFSGPLDKDGTLLYRLTADGFDTGTQTDFVREQRIAIAPTITWRPNTDTSLTVFANYQNDPEAGIYNSVPAVGTVLPGVVQLPRSFDPGEPDYDSFRKTQESIGYTFEHRFDDTWSVKQSYRFLHNDQTVQYVADDLGYVNNGTELAREPYLNTGTVNAHTLDNQVTAHFATGALDHEVTAGLDYQNIQFDHYFLFSLDNSPSLSVTNPQYGQSIAAPTFVAGTSGAESVRQLGTYAQDHIDIGHWSFLGGIREDWTDEDFDSYQNGSQTHQSNRAFTWRVGGVYQFDSGIAPYASYSKSFQPQVGTDYYGNAFAPTTGEQYEIGVKFQPHNATSFVTVSAFHLTEQNVQTPDPVHLGYEVLTGEIRSQGFEAEAHASLTNNLQLIGSYTYTNLLNTKSNDTNAGKVPVGIPRNTASLWADYTIDSSVLGGMLAGVQAGAGIRYIGGSYGDPTNTLYTTSATLIDIALRYDLGRAFRSMHGWTATLNVSNLLDRQYIASCQNDLMCTWGEGRLVLAGVKYQW